LLLEPELGFGEAYMDGSLEFSGDLQSLVMFAHRNFPEARRSAPRRAKPSLDLERQGRDIRFHYDRGNDFFRLFLDPTLTYSCAYFEKPGDSLEQAQRNKVRHSLRKLRLAPGETLLDIGSGWGHLLLRAAQIYHVEADGITLSQEQFRESSNLLQTAHVPVKISLADYRNFAGRPGGYDKVITIGMIEHVGHSNLPTFVDRVTQFVKPGGLALLHCMTHPMENAPDPWVTRYIFPGGYIPSLRELIQLFPLRDLHVWDVENLAPHYALTLDRWSENFERHLPEVRALFAGQDAERFIRMWRLYLRGAAASFRCGLTHLHQILVSHGMPRTLPPTRADLYQGTKVAEEQPVVMPSVKPIQPARHGEISD
jgi:cyclopropane-fatty-acyl-phospholipid synthase